jgi:NitT/TauT family transport system ATP-binding protein
MVDPILRLENLCKMYSSKTGLQTVLAPTSLTLEVSELVSIVGPSGCGKSTLLNIVAGLITPTSGSVFLDGVSVSEPGAERGMVFQAYTLFPWLTVRRNVEFGPKLRGVKKADRMRQADRLLKAVGLEEYRDYYPKQLSGGMRQRVAIARALANEPRILLMDEPFGALDAQTRTVMQELLLAIRQHERTTTLFITHDVEEATFLSDRIFVMTPSPGRIKAEIAVPFGPNRDASLRHSSQFFEIRAQIFDLLHTQHK